MIKEGSTKIVNFMTHRGSCAGAWPYKSYRENAFFLLKSSFLLQGIEQTNKLNSDDYQGKVYQNCKFLDPGAGVLMQGLAYISLIVKMRYLFKNLLLYSKA